MADVTRKLHSLEGILIPSDVRVSVTRDYGATAAEKSNELLLHMAIAVVSVGIFSIGILVDDAIVVVENITPHCRLPENRGLTPTEIAVRAVDQVGNPPFWRL